MRCRYSGQQQGTKSARGRAGQRRILFAIGIYIYRNSCVRVSREKPRILFSAGLVPGHALHEKGLKRQYGVGPLVGSQEQRVLLVLLFNRGVTARQPVIVFPHRFTWDFACSCFWRNVQEFCIRCLGGYEGCLSPVRTVMSVSHPARPRLADPLCASTRPARGMSMFWTRQVSKRGGCILVDPLPHSAPLCPDPSVEVWVFDSTIVFFAIVFSRTKCEVVNQRKWHFANLPHHCSATVLPIANPSLRIPGNALLCPNSYALGCTCPMQAILSFRALPSIRSACFRIEQNWLTSPSFMT